MPDTDASEAARALARVRWGHQVVDKAAQVVIERADQLDDDVRLLLHQATEESPRGDS